MMKRRIFLKTMAAGLVVPQVIPRGVLAAPGQPGANDRIVVGVIGCGGRVAGILSELPAGLQVAALADCDLRQMNADSVFGSAVGKMEKFSETFPKWKRYQDYREMFDQVKLDAVFVTTTTHARALIGIHAVEAGLDVYAEKPLTLTIDEGQALVKATRRHLRVFQVGTQCRSLQLYTWINSLVRNGAVGKVQKVVAHNFEGPVRREAKSGQPVPKELNWDMWCNQAPLVPYVPKELHPGCGLWGKWWEYDGGGLEWGMTGWGTHSLDMVQAALGTDYTGPVEAWPEKPGAQDSPVLMRYADGRSLELTLPRGHANFWGAIYQGPQGKIEFFLDKVESDPPEVVEGHPKPQGYPALPHLENWIACMKSRQRPNADVEIAHRSSTVCHLANIARQLGRRLRWDPGKEEFIGDDEANALRSRPRRPGYELPRAL
jgi:hypothetical protein